MNSRAQLKWGLIVLTLAGALALLVACTMITPTPAPDAAAPGQGTETAPQGGMMGRGMMGQGGMMGRGMMGQGGMMARHHAEIPAEYADLINPIAADEASLGRGAESYTLYCATCHGESGMGDGPAGAALDPAPAPIAHTSQMLSDGYLFWRVTEGGSHFETAMPVWQEVLDEGARWDVINYMRSLGSGAMQHGMGPGPRAGQGAAVEDHTAMLEAAMAAGVITQEEADLFERVHAVLTERYGVGNMAMQGMGMQGRGMMAMQRAVTEQAVRDGAITQEDGERFTEIHDRLIEEGLMQ